MCVELESKYELLPKRVDDVLEDLFETLELPSAEAIQELIMRVGMLRCLESLELIDTGSLNQSKEQLKAAIAKCSDMIRKGGRKGLGVFYYEFK